MKKIFLTITITLLIIGTTSFLSTAQSSTLKLATTTSTEDSGLLDELLPLFTGETDCEVDVIAVGTGQALELGKRGDADVLLVHAPELEKNFVKNNYGTSRTFIAYNDFVLVGPPEDPAGISDLDPATGDNVTKALKKIEEGGKTGRLTFVSRGDESGTHTKEKNIWSEAGLNDVEDNNWYLSLGQGMGSTLITANEMSAYALTDKATYLAMAEQIRHVKILYANDEALTNPYNVIPVNPDLHTNINYECAQKFVTFLTKKDTQDLIANFGKEKFGQPLFFPAAD